MHTSINKTLHETRNSINPESSQLGNPRVKFASPIKRPRLWDFRSYINSSKDIDGKRGRHASKSELCQKCYSSGTLNNKGQPVKIATVFKSSFPLLNYFVSGFSPDRPTPMRPEDAIVTWRDIVFAPVKILWTSIVNSTCGSPTPLLESVCANCNKTLDVEEYPIGLPPNDCHPSPPDVPKWSGYESWRHPPLIRYQNSFINVPTTSFPSFATDAGSSRTLGTRPAGRQDYLNRTRVTENLDANVQNNGYIEYPRFD